MKMKSLRFGKAMSAALFVLLLSVAGMKNALAQTQVATLQHGDEISAFYGTDAFKSAHTAAAEGDIITLSSGSFTVPDPISKAITLRGAGAVTDGLTGTAPTIFTQQVRINVPNDSIPFQMEGIMCSNEMIYYTLYNPKFTRCNFNKINCYNWQYSMLNAQFVNCIINNFGFSQANNTTLINCVVWNEYNITTSHTVVMYNSIMRCATNNDVLGGLSAFNSIFIRDNESGSAWCFPNANSSFSNCIGIYTGELAPFGDAYTSGCAEYGSYLEVFESFDGTFSFEESFILNNETATGFLGSDGTQVGIHGGILPYQAFPTYMVPVNCNVANKSNAEGKLNVEIEVINNGE